MIIYPQDQREGDRTSDETRKAHEEDLFKGHLGLVAENKLEGVEEADRACEPCNYTDKEFNEDELVGPWKGF
jgi:hypothetical protein